MEGFLYNTIGKLMGIKPSAGDPEVCNKCAAEATQTVVAEEPVQPVQTEPTSALAPEAPAATPEVQPQAEPEKKDEVQL